MRLGDLLKLGREIDKREHRELEAEKIGTLRAGNSGILSDNGDVAGSCPRVTYLRSIGTEVEDHEDHKLIMFQMGIANEDVIHADLLKSLADSGYVIKREEDVPITWQTSGGISVTGRPDMVICHGDSGLPKLGIEIKGIASPYTALDVILNAPKLSHVIQAAHYSYRLGKQVDPTCETGIPYRLLYKNYVNHVVPGFKMREVNSLGRRLPQFEYNDKGDVKYIVPFELVYELRITRAGFLQYREEPVSADVDPCNGEKGWIQSIVNVADINRYYEFTASMAERDDIGNRPMTITPTGEELSYSNCKYCPLDHICREMDKVGSRSLADWLLKVNSEVVE